MTVEAEYKHCMIGEATHDEEIHGGETHYGTLAEALEGHCFQAQRTGFWD
jgi:hypothetical protein